MNQDDEARLKWLKDNPSKTYNDLPQHLWDESQVATAVARQAQASQLEPGPASQPWPPIPVFGGWR